MLKARLPNIIYDISRVTDLCCAVGLKYAANRYVVNSKIAFQVVGRGGRSLYSTNFENYNAEAVTKVMNLPLTERTYFNSDLLKSFGNVFRVKSSASVKVSDAACNPGRSVCVFIHS